MLLEEFLKPLGMTQVELAEKIHVSYPRVNEIVNGKRGVTPDTALRLSALFGTSPEFWLNGAEELGPVARDEVAIGQGDPEHQARCCRLITVP